MDQNKQKKGEKAVHQFEALFSHATMGIIIVNESGDIILANQFALQQFGYDTGEITGKKIELLIPARFHSSHVRQRQGYVEHMKNRPMGLGMDLFGTRKDGTEFPVEVSLGHYEIEEEKFIMAFVSDITKRKEQENAIVQLNTELEQKVAERTKSLTETLQKLEQQFSEIQVRDQKLSKVNNDLNNVEEELRRSLRKEKELGELKSRFVSTASHEFRTPLSTVLSSAYLLSKYVSAEDQPKREKHIQRIVSSVNMLTDILNDFLSIGKIEEGKIQVRWNEFDLAAHLETIIQEMRTLLKKGQVITYSHEGPVMVLLDPGLVKHIVLNLLSNAIKFSPEDRNIEVCSVNHDSKIILSVKDTGIGISEDDQEHLFERFFRGANVMNIQGTGLGLHIIGKYVELMNGTIICNSILEQGTEFIITFNKQTNADEQDISN
jgi:PAS domain S-box-containing protein